MTQTLTYLFLFLSIIAKSQTVQTHTETPIVVSENIGIHPEEMPEYPGGTTALLDFLKTNVQYPNVVLEKAINGKVFVKFTVDTLGSIKDIKVLKGIKDCAECDEEAKRLISIMPKWKPGKVNGKLTPVNFNIPIKFQAQ